MNLVRLCHKIKNNFISSSTTRVENPHKQQDTLHPLEVYKSSKTCLVKILKNMGQLEHDPLKYLVKILKP